MMREKSRRPSRSDGATQENHSVANFTSESRLNRRAEFPAGPLRPHAPVPLPTNLYDDDQLTRWLAYVGLDGRWCWVGIRQWRRWDGKTWKPTRVEYVREAVRLALTSLIERSTGRAGWQELLTIDRTFALTERLRLVVKVDAPDVEVSA